MQRQLRLGDILDDYCPRERRLTNHAIVAMVGDDVKQTRCTTCDTEHEYKHAKVPRQRHKDTPAGLQAQILAAGPKRVPTERADAILPPPAAADLDARPEFASAGAASAVPPHGTISYAAGVSAGTRNQMGSGNIGSEDRVDGDGNVREGTSDSDEPTGVARPPEVEGPAHRRLIRATLPRVEGQPQATRPAPDFTIRAPSGGRPNRFRARQRGGAGSGGGAGQSFQGQRPSQPGNAGRGGQRGGSTRSQHNAPQSRRFDGRKRSK